MFWRRRCKTTQAFQTIAVLIADLHTDLSRTIKEARMSIETDLSDLAAEVAATKSAEAAATTAFNGVVQQLQQIQQQNAGNPTAYASQIEQFTAALASSRGDMSAAITANTPPAGQADPDAPPPAVTAASGGAGSNTVGSNTYGSNGPQDTPNSAGTVAGTTTNGAADATVPVTASPTAGDPTKPASAPDASNTGSTPPAGGAPASSTTTPDTTKDASASTPPAASATVAGDPAPEQDRPAGQEVGMAARTEESTNFGSAPGGNVASTASADKE